MTNEELEAKLLVALDRITKLEAEVKRLGVEVLKTEVCTDCRRPGVPCDTCNGTGKRSGGHEGEECD